MCLNMCPGQGARLCRGKAYKMVLEKINKSVNANQF